MTSYVEFAPAGSAGGIPLVLHQCARYSAPYVSAAPSPLADPYECLGCPFATDDWSAMESHAKSAHGQAIQPPGSPYLVPGCGCRPLAEAGCP